MNLVDIESISNPKNVQGNTMIKIYIIRLTRSTIAYKLLVCPLFRESITVKIDRASRIMDFIVKPRINGKSMMVQTITTVGILSPILANAEPSARLMLV